MHRMLQQIALLYVIISILQYGNSARFMKQHVLRLYRFTQCEGEEGLPMVFENITIHTVNRHIVINCKIVVKHELKNDISPVLLLQRCKNKDALDTCQTYQTFRFPRSCNLFTSRGQFWSPFMEMVKPAFVCPVQANTYTVENATLDATNVLFPVGGWYWKATLNTYDVLTKERLTCIYLEGEVKAVSSKSD